MPPSPTWDARVQCHLLMLSALLLTVACADLGTEGVGECKDAIERRGRYDVRWTNSWSESVFHTESEVYGASAQSTPNRITRWGDKVKFQNMYGAWVPATYRCTYDLDNQRVADVEVHLRD